MSREPGDLLSRVPTLTEVLDLRDTADWQQAGPPLQSDAQSLEEAQRWVDGAMDKLAPQLNALVTSRLRDLMATAVQDAVEDAIERCRGPLIEALEVRLRDLLEQQFPPAQPWPRVASGVRRAPGRGPSGGSEQADSLRDRGHVLRYRSTR